MVVKNEALELCSLGSNPSSALTSCANLGKILDLSVFQMPHL